MPMDKPLSYVALARKAGRIELGEEPVGNAAGSGKACLILVPPFRYWCFHPNISRLPII